MDLTPETVGSILGGALLVLGGVAKGFHALGAKQQRRKSEPPAEPEQLPHPPPVPVPYRTRADSSAEWPALDPRPLDDYSREELIEELQRKPMTAREVGQAVREAVAPVSEEVRGVKTELVQLRESLPCKPNGDGDPDDCPAAEVRPIREVRR